MGFPVACKFGWFAKNKTVFNDTRIHKGKRICDEDLGTNFVHVMQSSTDSSSVHRSVLALPKKEDQNKNK